MNVKVKAGFVAGLSTLLLVTMIITGLGRLISPVGGIWNSSNQANYPEYMEVKDPSLGSIVKVYRDHMGIPHIYAASEADFVFAIGYVQAQDRLFSIDIERRFVKGQISEFMGPEFLDADKEARFIGFDRYGKAMWAALQNHSDPLADTLIFSTPFNMIRTDTFEVLCIFCNISTRL